MEDAISIEPARHSNEIPLTSDVMSVAIDKDERAQDFAARRESDWPDDWMDVRAKSNPQSCASVRDQVSAALL